MATFRLEPNNAIYLYHWLDSDSVVKLSTKFKIEPEKWDKNKGRARSSNYKYKGNSINKELVRHEMAFHDALNFYAQNPGYSKSNLKSKYKEYITIGSLSNSKTKKVKFLDYFTEVHKKLKEKNSSSWKGYGTTLNHLNAYFINREPAFEDIDTNFYMLFNDYLIDKSLAKNTISNHWKHIKTVMKMSQYAKLHSNTDYKLFKRSRENSDSIYLSEEELDKIYDLNKLSRKLSVARDYFIIGCYTGLRFSDWDQLDISKVKDNMVSIRSTKTGELSLIPIHERVIKILKKYKSGLPKKPCNQKMNEYLKTIGLHAKINDTIESRITKGGKPQKSIYPKYKLITTHTARRSFATILVLKGVSPYVIMKITGHKSLSSFEKYVKIEELQASIQLKDIDFFKHNSVAENTSNETSEIENDMRLLLVS